MGLNAAQRGFADEIGLHIKVHEPVEAQLIGVGLDVCIGVIGQHPTLDPADGGGVTGFQAKGQAGCHDAFPQGIAMGAVAQVNLIAQFAGPTGARDQQRNAVQLQLAQPVVFQIKDAVAEKGLHDFARFGPLQLQRRDIGFANGHIETGVHGHALRPKQDVAIGERDPEVVFGKAQQDGVIQKPALGIGDQDVFALADRHLGQITRGQALYEFGRIGAGDFDLTFHGHIAQDRGLREGPEILLRVAEIARDIHVVIDREPLGPPAHGGLEIGGFADLGAEAEIICLHVLSPLCAAGRKGHG